MINPLWWNHAYLKSSHWLSSMCPLMGKEPDSVNADLGACVTWLDTQISKQVEYGSKSICPAGHFFLNADPKCYQHLWTQNIYTVSQKQGTHIMHHNSRRRGQILIILSLFHTHMNRRKDCIRSTTSPQICCRTTVRKLNIQLCYFTAHFRWGGRHNTIFFCRSSKNTAVRIIETGPYMRELSGIMCVPHFLEIQRIMP